MHSCVLTYDPIFFPTISSTREPNSHGLQKVMLSCLPDPASTDERSLASTNVVNCRNPASSDPYVPHWVSIKYRKLNNLQHQNMSYREIQWHTRYTRSQDTLIILDPFCAQDYSVSWLGHEAMSMLGCQESTRVNRIGELGGMHTGNSAQLGLKLAST